MKKQQFSPPNHDAELERKIKALTATIEACLPKVKPASQPAPSLKNGTVAPQPPVPQPVDSWHNLETQIHHLVNHYQSLQKKYYLALANHDNETRRLQNEHQSEQKYQHAGLGKNLLKVADDFERALGSNPANPEIQGFLMGFKMIYQNFIAALKQADIHAIPVKVGDKFNHHLHHAVDTKTTKLIQPDHIVAVLERGYQLHDLVLRHTKVVVARAPSPPATSEPKLSK